MVDGIIHRSPGGKAVAPPTETITSATPASPTQNSAQATPPASSVSADAKEYFVKKQSDDETKTGFWLTLTDDSGPTLAHYKGTELTDGFANIKGEMKTENGKTFIEISELIPEA